MKIKDVIQQTELTDRAIRLYISNGLIQPECQRSYTGRNILEFSEADVELLKKIALLRKAGFSLEQISCLQRGGPEAGEMLMVFLQEKQNEVELNEKVINALKGLPDAGIPSFDEVCGRIQNGFAQGTVPEEDMQPTRLEKIEKWFFRILSIAVLMLNGLFLAGVQIVFDERFPFAKWYSIQFTFVSYFFVVLPLVLALILLWLYRKPRLKAAQRKKRRWVAGILAAITLFTLIVIQPRVAGILWFMPPVYSETNDPGNYLQVGEYVRSFGKSIHGLFPADIPRSAVAEDSRWYPPDKFPETTQYYYFHEKVFDDRFDIYAQWVLPDVEYEEEKQRLLTAFETDGCYQTQKGDWTCLHFTDSTEESVDHSYYFLIFAYQDKTKTVRYIASYAIDAAEEWLPYYLSLEW